ncbi:MAG: nucleotidyltransferase family protein [Cyclobacteriaceae bacterium]|nr:nucleotidyltransferase family protein [Cyclobacteriaceae bacterium]
MNIGIILLAAGSSSRLGQSKQLVQFENKTLLRRTTEVALETKPHNVVVVLGSDEPVHRQLIADLPVKIVYNKTWEKGMGNSLKTGLHHLLNLDPTVDAVIILVCDQPYLKSENINSLITAFQSENIPIVASAYDDIMGVPALFGKSTFASLGSLDDQSGARKILRQYPIVKSVPFPQGRIDVDTPEDLLHLSVNRQ